MQDIAINGRKLHEIQMLCMPWNQNTVSHLCYPKQHIDFAFTNDLIELTAPAFLVLEMYRQAILPQDQSVPVSIEIEGRDQGEFKVKDFRYPNSGGEVIHIALQHIANSGEPVVPSWMKNEKKANNTGAKRQSSSWEVLKVSIECVFGPVIVEPFLRVVEIPTIMTLEDLHIFINDDLLDFDHDHMSVFYIANTCHGNRIWLTDPEDSGLDEKSAWLKTLGEIYPLGPHKKLYYLYDFGDSWTFEIRKKGKAFKPNPEILYPRVIYEEGPRPVQYPPCEDF
ncbi:MAG: hypothetical protein V1816_09060 [Pseudomonadota bacterium]